MIRKKKILSIAFIVSLLGGCLNQNEVPKDPKQMIQIGQAEYASHGDKSFTVAVVALADDKIVDSFIDEYQYMADTNKAVPNAEMVKSFWKEGVVLASKRINASEYSKNMTEKGGATVAIDDNFNKIQDYVRNRTISELEDLVKKDAQEVIDSVSGATLADTSGYIRAIIEAAKNAQNNPEVEYAGDLQKLSLKQSDTAAEGETSFIVTTLLMDDEKIVTAYIDEFEYMVSEEITPVPNSETMNDNLVDNGISLGSKRVNSEFYSANMTQFGKATMTISENLDGIQEYVSGKTISELSQLRDKKMEDILDVISSSTLTGIKDYLNGIIQAAENSK